MNYHRYLVLLSAAVISLSVSSKSVGDLIFEENFDAQPDFTSTMHSTEKAQKLREGYTLPAGWDSLYQGTQWSPELGYPNNHASLEILAKNSDKAYGGEGKSAVMWRESFSLSWKNWASDSQLVKFLEKQYPQLYVEFYIRFSPNFYSRENASNFMSKVFRVGSWDGKGDEFSGFQGALGPIYLWDYKRDVYGLRSVHSFRGGPWGENYTFNGQYAQDKSLNYGSHTKGQAEEGGDPKLIDQVYGGFLSDVNSAIGHNQVFGAGAQWTKVAFFVRMNSTPGKADGVLRQWVNNQRILNLEDIPWVQTSASNHMVGWNYIGIGGNDYFQPYPNDERYEDWYAIDNLVVRSTMPSLLQDVAPNPPVDIGVQ
ncbi:hypothetical protein [Marinobacter sp.]|uniref:hypothetical protein n=1 Tax=Marinobacter sp. TaxID=50741 RepID=UPI003A904428